MKFSSVRRGAMAVAVVGMLATSPGLAVAAQEPGGESVPPWAFESATFAEQDVTVERVTDGVHMTEDALAPVRGFTGPTSMLVDPSDPTVIVAATANLRSRVCHLLRSTDAGRTWSILDALPAPDDYPYCTNNTAGVTQSSIAWGSDGSLYYAAQAYGEGEGAQDGHESVMLARSTDLGDSWSTTLVMDNRGKTGPDAPSASAVTGLVVDTSGDEDVVYVGFSLSYDDAPEDSPLTNSPVVVATSTDGGERFGEPVNLNDFSEVTQTIDGTSYPLIMSTGFGRPFITARDGVVLAVANPTTPFDVELPGDSYYAHPQLVARSTDQGRTWSVTELGPPIFTGTGAQTGLGWTPEGGPDGTFVLAYAATPETAESSGLADIVVQRSTDMGQTWTEPLAIDDDDPGDSYNSFYPMLNVAPNGRVDVVWQDNRQLTDFRFNVRYSYSTDGGETWAENVQVSDQPLDFNLGISFNSDVRQPPGVASANAYAAFGWADSRFADEVNQTQDDFGSVAQFRPVPTASSFWPIVAAVFGGLAVAGIVLLAAQSVRRRRPQPAPSSA